jgi:hypothetical protein
MARGTISFSDGKYKYERRLKLAEFAIFIRQLNTLLMPRHGKAAW